MRVALQNKKYLISHYATELLLYCKGIPIIPSDYSNDTGKTESEKLLATCSQILNREELMNTEKPCYYSDVKEYIQRHPLPFLEDKTKAHLYFLKLFYERFSILKSITEPDIIKLEDIPLLQPSELEQRIKSFLTHPNKLDNFKKLTIQHFGLQKAITFFALSNFVVAGIPVSSAVKNPSIG